MLLWPLLFTLVASIGVLLGALGRRGQGGHRSRIERACVATRIVAAACWLGSFLFFGWWILNSDDPAVGAFVWPGSVLMTASVFALAASLASLLLVALTPGALRAGEGWSRWRKLRHVGTVASFLALALVFFNWGALSLAGLALDERLWTPSAPQEGAT